MEKIKFSDGVSETLLINLYFRSLENLVKKPILKDEFSGEIIKHLDYDFSKFDKSKLSRVGTVIRAKFFDDEILKIANEDKSENNDLVIIQVGAGLDTRPLRLESKIPNAIFYDLDLCDVINLREKLVKKAKNNFYITSSMFETTWMDELVSKHKNAKFIFVLEGVTMYFEKPKLKEFFKNLLDRFHGVLMADFLNKFAANFPQSRHDAMKFIKNAKFKFGIDSEDEILEFDDRLKFIKKGAMFDMYKNRWGVLGFILRNFVPKVKNSCNMYIFKLN